MYEFETGTRNRMIEGAEIAIAPDSSFTVKRFICIQLKI